MAQLPKRFGRTHVLTLRLTPYEMSLIRRAAREERSVSDYARGVLVADANSARIVAKVRVRKQGK